MKALLTLAVAPLACLHCSSQFLPIAPVRAGVPRSEVAHPLNRCEAVQLSDVEFSLECGEAHDVRVIRVNEEYQDVAQQKAAELSGPDIQVVSAPNLFPDKPGKVQSWQAPQASGGILAAVPHAEEGTLLVTCRGVGSYDVNYCGEVIKAIVASGVPEALFVPLRPTELDLFGRNVTIESSCWLGLARRLDCNRGGRLEWTEYQTAEGAEAGARQRYESLKRKFAGARGQVTADGLMPVLFEGVETDAYRAEVQGSPDAPVRIVFVAQAQVRGHHALAACTFLESEAPWKRLPPMCRRVLAFEEEAATRAGR